MVKKTWDSSSVDSQFGRIQKVIVPPLAEILYFDWRIAEAFLDNSSADPIPSPLCKTASLTSCSSEDWVSNDSIVFAANTSDPVGADANRSDGNRTISTAMTSGIRNPNMKHTT